MLYNSHFTIKKNEEGIPVSKYWKEVMKPYIFMWSYFFVDLCWFNSCFLFLFVFFFSAVHGDPYFGTTWTCIDETNEGEEQSFYVGSWMFNKFSKLLKRSRKSLTSQ